MTIADLPPLPKIEIPQLPFEVPLLMHPVVVHFAIAIPILVLVLELFNLFFKRRALNVITSVLLVALSAIYLALYITGKTDGSEAYALFSDEVKTAFKAHVLLGTYLIYSSILLIVFKVMALLFKKPFFTALYLIIMIVFIGVNLKQGKSGGELVFTHGANVEALADVKSDQDDLNDEIEEMTEQMDSLKEEIATLKEEAKNLKCKEVQESTDAVLKESAKTAEEDDVEAIDKPAVEDSATQEVVEISDEVTDTAQKAEDAAKEEVKADDAVESVMQEANATIAK